MTHKFTALRERLLAVMPAFTAWLLGEPESVEGPNWRYPHGLSVCVEGDRVGGAWDHANNRSVGGPLELLAFVGVSESEARAWLVEANPAPSPAATSSSSSSSPSAERFEQICADLHLDDGRIAAYLVYRGLSGALADLLRLTKDLRGRQAMVALAVDDSQSVRAVQLLGLNSLGRPALWPNGKKMRRTFTGAPGWAEHAAFRIPAEEEAADDEIALVEGVEDALALRAAGWKRAIAATLGKGNLARFQPSQRHVLLVPDGDVPLEEVDGYVEHHARAGRVVRVAALPDELDPLDMLAAGRGDELHQLLWDAPERHSEIAELERELLAFPFTSSGELRFERNLSELAERLRLSKPTISAARKKLRLAHEQKKHQAEVDVEVKSTLRSVREIEPASEPVDGTVLFDELADELGRFILFPNSDELARPPGVVAAALWVVMTHTFDPFDSDAATASSDLWSTAPRLRVAGPTKRVGKTRLLDLLACLCRRALRAESVSPASVFRVLELVRPTLLLDEVDQARLHAEGDALVQIINSGFDAGGCAMRIGGENRDQIQDFRTFAPLALAGIGVLPDTIEDRSIRISLQRKSVSMVVDRLTPGRRSTLQHLASRIRRWSIDHHAALTMVGEPDFPGESGSDRARDAWRPLLAIARVMGKPVEAVALEAFRSIANEGPVESQAEDLIVAVRSILRDDLARRPTLTKVATQRLATKLSGMEGPWNDFRSVRALWLGRKLNGFGLKARQVRDPLFDKPRVSGFDIAELLKVAEQYAPTTTDEKEEDETGDQPKVYPSSVPAEPMTSSDSPDTPDNEARAATVRGVIAVRGRQGSRKEGKDTPPRRKKKPARSTGSKSALPLPLPAEPLTSPDSSDMPDSDDETQPVIGVRAVRGGQRSRKRGEDTSSRLNGSTSGPAPLDVAIDLSLLGPHDIFPRRLTTAGHRCRPDGAVEWKEGTPPASDPAIATELMQDVIAHRTRAWKRLQAKKAKEAKEAKGAKGAKGATP